jgi:hypothetical protein
MKRYIGLRNIVTSKQDWKYLLLYEVDGHEESNAIAIKSLYERMHTSYIAYKTLNGYHFVGLTPMGALEWGSSFSILRNYIPEYFSGQTLRLSLKENEKQEIYSYSLRFPYLERLAKMYFKRFGLNEKEMPKFGEMPKYVCVFERYWTGKIE